MLSSVSLTEKSLIVTELFVTICLPSLGHCIETFSQYNYAAIGKPRSKSSANTQKMLHIMPKKLIA
jgi:hypothetical protein